MTDDACTRACVSYHEPIDRNYHEQHRDDELLPEEDRKKLLLAALVVISTGVEDAEALGVPVDVGRKLLACYDALEEELK